MVNSVSTPATIAIEDGVTTASLEMCLHAFSTILTRLRSENEERDIGKLPKTKGGVFVTWSILNGRRDKYSLRGCIGTLKPTMIDSAVPHYAAIAAFNDPRFTAITLNEISRLKVGVSILSKFERSDNVYDWTVGVHGIILEFGNGQYSATYLPEVAGDHGWTQEFCVQSLAEKAGFRGNFEKALFQDAVVTRYQSTKVEMTYDEYLEAIQA